jgi:hypothetical protein
VAGKAFLIARPVHIRRAWRKVIDLYEKNGKPELALDAQQQLAAFQAKTTFVSVPLYSGHQRKTALQM